MTISSDTLLMLADMPTDAIPGMLRILAAQEKAQEDRKAKERERKAQYRAGQSGDNPGTETALSPDAGRDTSPEERKSPTPPKETQPLTPKERTLRVPKKGCAIPDGYEPDVTWAIGEGLPPERAVREASKLRDWAVANGVLKKDWPATWRNWVRNILDGSFKGSTGPPGRHPEKPKSASEKMIDELQAFRTPRANGSQGPPGPGTVIDASDFRRVG